jgi:surface polysaccharide O-acyltransferase-like enzyme
MGYYQNWNLNIPHEYAKYIRTFDFISSTGPLWFALALLIFSLIYAAFRKSCIAEKQKIHKSLSVSSKQIFGIGVLISVFTFLTRIVFPIGTNILNMQLCFFPQYIVLFILGIFFFRKNLLLNIPYKLGMTWFKYTLIFGLIFWLGMTGLGNAAEKGLAPFTGHFTLGNAAYSIWESFFCVGVCLGLIVWFRDKFNRQGAFGKFLSDNAFGVYIFHTPLLVFISMLMKDVAMYPFFKYLIVAVTTIPLCFLVSYAIRKIPGVAYVIK